MLAGARSSYLDAEQRGRYSSMLHRNLLPRNLLPRDPSPRGLPKPRCSGGTLPRRSIIPTRARIAATALLMLTTALPAARVSAASSAHWCECVEYVKNYYGLRGAAGDAKDMGAFLAAHGFRRSSEPAAGAVLVLQPGWY